MSNTPPTPIDPASLDKILAQLPAAIQPTDISWWPPAPGWIILTTLTIGLLAFAIYQQWRLYRETRILRRARSQLKSLIDQRKENTSKNADASQPQSVADASVLSIAMLIRWVCKDYFKHSALVTASGDAWLQQLDTLALVKQKTLSGNAGQTLLNIYKNHSSTDAEATQLEAACADWINTLIRHHRKIKKQRIALEATTISHSLQPVTSLKTATSLQQGTES